MYSNFAKCSNTLARLLTTRAHCRQYIFYLYKVTNKLLLHEFSTLSGLKIGLNCKALEITSKTAFLKKYVSPLYLITKITIKKVENINSSSCQDCERSRITRNNLYSIPNVASHRKSEAIKPNPPPYKGRIN